LRLGLQSLSEIDMSANSLKNQFRETLGAAIEADSGPTDDAIHATRKTLKRARAALRLLRAGIGDAVYRDTNRQLRDTARPLTEVRDAVALLAALKSIRKRRDRKPLHHYADEVHRALLDRHRLKRDRVTGETLRLSGEKLRAADLKVHRAPASMSDAPSARRGIKKTYCVGRKAFAKVRKRPSVGLLHEWRKQVKYLANEIDLAERLSLLDLKRQRRRAERLADALGGDRDLALLWDSLREVSPEARGTARNRLQQRIRKKRSKLQRKAYRLGGHLYGATVAEFNRTLKKQLKRSRRS
jgi:hypothetical protein